MRQFLIMSLSLFSFVCFYTDMHTYVCFYVYAYISLSGKPWWIHVTSSFTFPQILCLRDSMLLQLVWNSYWWILGLLLPCFGAKLPVGICDFTEESEVHNTCSGHRAIWAWGLESRSPSSLPIILPTVLHPILLIPLLSSSSSPSFSSSSSTTTTKWFKSYLQCTWFM